MADEGQQPERMLRLKEVCRRAGYEKSSIYAMIRKGEFPAPYKTPGGSSRWSEVELGAGSPR